MTYIYIPLAGGAPLADTLARGVYKLSQPDSVRPEDYVTTHSFGWLVHPQSGAVMLEINQVQFVPMHVAADPEPLLRLLSELKDDHDQPLTTAEEREALGAAVRNYGGQRVPLSYLVPEKAMLGAKTHKQLVANGWFDPSD